MPVMYTLLPEFVCFSYLLVYKSSRDTASRVRYKFYLCFTRPMIAKLTDNKTSFVISKEQSDREISVSATSAEYEIPRRCALLT